MWANGKWLVDIFSIARKAIVAEPTLGNERVRLDKVLAGLVGCPLIYLDSDLKALVVVFEEERNLTPEGTQYPLMLAPPFGTL